MPKVVESGSEEFVVLLEDVYLIKVVGVVEENQDVEEGDGATGVVMLLGEVGGGVDGDAGHVPKLCKPSSKGVLLAGPVLGVHRRCRRGSRSQGWL